MRKKQRRYSTKTDRAIKHPGRVNREIMEAGMKGLIPWSAAGIFETLAYVHRQMRPDRVLDTFEEPGFLIDLGGEVRGYTFNRYIPEYHAAFHLNRKYGWPKSSAHFFRYFRVGDFVSANRAVLESRGLLRPGSRKGALEVDEALVEALAVLPYSKEVASTKGETEWDFDLAEVLQKRDEIEAKWASSESG